MVNLNISERTVRNPAETELRHQDAVRIIDLGYGYMTQTALRAFRGAESPRPCIHARTLLVYDIILTASKWLRKAHPGFLLPAPYILVEYTIHHEISYNLKILWHYMF